MEKSELSAPWQRTLVINRRLTFGLVALSMVCLGLICAIVYMLPLKTIELQVVEYRTGTNNFVVVHKAGEDIQANDLLLEREIARYVIDRETVDKITEDDRYPRVYAMSSNDEATKFRNLYGGDESLYAEPGFTREVEILRVSRLARYVFQVEFKTVDKKVTVSSDKVIEKTNEWVASLQISYIDQLTAFDDKMNNPMGIIVDRYNLARRKSL